MIQYYNTISMPLYAIYYLEYGDMSGLEQEDIETIDTWYRALVEQSGAQYITFEYGDEQFFTNLPEFGLPFDCVDCKIYVQKAMEYTND